MSNPNTNLPSARNGISLWLRRADQGTVAALILLGVGALVANWTYRGGLHAGVVEIDSASPLPLTWQVDVNSADWLELSVLPDVGDQLAREIVENRRRFGPFLSPTDLRRVRGVGPRTVARIEPYLAPFPARPVQELPAKQSGGVGRTRKS